MAKPKKEKKEKKKKKDKKNKKDKKHKKKKPKEKTIPELVEEFKTKAYKEDVRERAHFRNGAEGIFLRVYWLNKFLDWVGFGLYHTSIQIYGQEYYYGGHDSEITGIVETEIGQGTTLYLKETLLVGYTYYDADDVDLILDEFGKFWYGWLYDPFRHNCNDFAKALSQHLAHEEGLWEFPEYVNRFTKFSSVLRVWFEPLKSLFGDIVNAPVNQNEGEGEGEDAEEEKFDNIPEQLQQEKDQHFDKIIIEARREAENSNSFYITGFYENAKNVNMTVLNQIKFYANDISEVKDLRLATMFNLAMWCQKMNQINDMIDYCTMCISTDPQNPKYFIKRGLAYAYHQNNYSQALIDLEYAHNLDPNDPVIIDEIKKVKEKLVNEQQDLSEV